MQLRGVVLAVVSAAALALVGSPSELYAEKATGTPPLNAPASAGSQSAIPDAFKLSMLIRTTLIALSQANLTGNYSVLRDLGTFQFQATNTDARLAEIFAGLRGRNLDFSPVVFFDPKLIRPPALEGSILRLTGFIPTKPQRIIFDMGFEQFGSEWRISAIVIDIQQAPVDAAAQQSGEAAPLNEKPAPKEKASGKTKAKTKAPPAAPTE